MAQSCCVLGKQEKGQEGAPHNFLPIPREVGSSPALQRQSKLQGLGILGRGEGLGQALVPTVLSITVSSPNKQETLRGISSQWCIEVLCCIFFQLQNYFNKAAVLPSSYLHFPPAIALQGSAHTSPLDSNFPSARAFQSQGSVRGVRWPGKSAGRAGRSTGSSGEPARLAPGWPLGREACCCPGLQPP